MPSHQEPLPPPDPPAAPIPSHQPRPLWLRLLRLLLLLYVGLLLVFYSLQTRMIFPGHDLQGKPEAVIQPRRGTELVRLVTRSGDPLVGLYGPALEPTGQPHADAAAQPTLLYFYGNGECVNFSESEFEQFRRLGCNVLIVDYAGFGMSGGNPSETNCEQSADAAYDYLTVQRAVRPDKLYVCGWSLGGAVAVGLASRHQVAGLMIFSTFTSAVEMGKRMLPFLPVSLLLTHRFDSLSKIARLNIPVLIAHGRRDSIVPFDMAETLAATSKQAGCPVQVLWLDAAGHNNFYELAGSQLNEAIKQFLRETQDRHRPDPL